MPSLPELSRSELNNGLWTSSKQLSGLETEICCLDGIGCIQRNPLFLFVERPKHWGLEESSLVCLVGLAELHPPIEHLEPNHPIFERRNILCNQIYLHNYEQRSLGKKCFATLLKENNWRLSKAMASSPLLPWQSGYRSGSYHARGRMRKVIATSAEGQCCKSTIQLGGAWYLDSGRIEKK